MKVQSPPYSPVMGGALLQMTGAVLKINIACSGEIRSGFTKWLLAVTSALLKMILFSL